MKIRELVEELKKCNKRMKVVFIDEENKELKIDTKVQVDDGGWDQLTFITEKAYEDEIGSKKFFCEMDTDFMKACLDHEFGDEDRFEISIFSDAGNLNFFDYEVRVCVEIDGCAWGTVGEIRCSIIDGDKFAIIAMDDEEKEE